MRYYLTKMPNDYLNFTFVILYIIYNNYFLYFLIINIDFIFNLNYYNFDNIIIFFILI